MLLRHVAALAAPVALAAIGMRNRRQSWEPPQDPDPYIFQKDWPFTHVINYHMVRMLEDGSLERIRQRWLPKAMLCNDDSIEPSNILDIFTLGVVLIIGGIIALVSLLIEFGYKNASKPY